LIAGICPTCGLPKEICVCEDLGRETTQLSVEMDTRRYGKAVTVVRGLETKPDEAEKLARDLKKGLATGAPGRPSQRRRAPAPGQRVQRALTGRRPLSRSAPFAAVA